MKINSEFVILALGGVAAFYAMKRLAGPKRKPGIVYWLNGKKVYAPYKANGKPDFSKIRAVNDNTKIGVVY